jgi:hypothetical protein
MNKKNKDQSHSKGEIIIYRAKDGEARLEVNLREKTVWLTQKQLSLLFGIERSVVTKHLKNIFSGGELKENSVCAFLHIATT